MDRYRFLILIFLLFLSSFASSQTYWKVENEYGDEILLTVEVNRTKNTFEAFSRKDALKELAGVFTYTLAKAAGKLKHPEIVFIEGRTLIKNDSLFLNGDFYYFDKHFMFSASITGSHFDGSYLDNRGKSHQLTGTKVPDIKPIKDYGSMINTAFSLTEKCLVNAKWLKTDEWDDFKKKVNNLKLKISDDYELAATCFWLGKKLPFTPFEINKARPHQKLSGRRMRAGIREIKSSCVIMDANSIPGTKMEMDSIASIVRKKGYRSLVIDLRGNNRLSPVNANILLGYIASQPFKAGVYLTRRWSDINPVIPQHLKYDKLFKDFNEHDYASGLLYTEDGRYLDVVPGKNSFNGKIYLLTDSKTSRAAEMVAYTLKSRKIATIVGQKSAGVTCLTESIRINSEYDLILPDCDFYTPEGKSLSNVGVEPDIEKSGTEVMNYILSII